MTDFNPGDKLTGSYIELTFDAKECIIVSTVIEHHVVIKYYSVRRNYWQYVLWDVDFIEAAIKDGCLKLHAIKRSAHSVKAVDAVGNSIYVGAEVVYALSDNCTLKKGMVLNVTSKTVHIAGRVRRNHNQVVVIRDT